MALNERDWRRIAAGEPAWGNVDAGTTSVTYWLAQPSPTEAFLFRMVVRGDSGPIYFEGSVAGRWAEDAMGLIYEGHQDGQPTDLKLSGRQAAEVMRNLAEGRSEVWRDPDKPPPHGFAMALATAAVFGAIYLAIGAAFLSVCDSCGPLEGIQPAVRALVGLSPFWLRLLGGLAWRFRTALAAFVVAALAMAVLTMILGTDLAESLGALGLSSMRGFWLLALPYAIAGGAGLVEYRRR